MTKNKYPKYKKTYFMKNKWATETDSINIVPTFPTAGMTKQGAPAN